MTKYNFDEKIERRGSNCIKYDKLKDYFGKADAMPLWVADTDFRVPDFIVDAMQKRLGHGIFGYSYRPESYFNAVTSWMKRRHGWNIKKDWVSSSPGVVSAITTAIMAFSKPGDKVIIQPPVYFPFFTCVRGSNRKIVENPLVVKDERYTFDFDDLASKIDANTRLLVLCNPQNPGGMVWKHEELEELGRICAKKEIIVISDEIHSDLVFSGHKHIPLPCISTWLRDNCIVCMAPNKTFNIAGLASAVVIAPNKKLYLRYEQMLNVIHVHGGNIFGNIATEAAYLHGEEWLGQLIDYLEETRNFVVEYFKVHLPKVKVMKPEATFLMWLDFNSYGIPEDKVFHKLINDAGIAMNKGSMFGTGGEGYFRLNIGCPRSTLTDALNKIREAFKHI